MKLKKVTKNRILINKFIKHEMINLLIKSFFNSKYLCFFLKDYVYFKYIINLKYLNLKLGCLITHRMRSKYNFFNISRIKIRDLASYKLLTGIRKAGW